MNWFDPGFGVRRQCLWGELGWYSRMSLWVVMIVNFLDELNEEFDVFCGFVWFFLIAMRKAGAG